MTLVLSSLSLEQVRVRVSGKRSGNVIDPTSDVVQMAFKQADTEPSGGDWKSATWETDATTSPPTYYAMCLVGPGGTVALADGNWQTWVKVTDSPEIPVHKVGKLTVS